MGSRRHEAERHVASLLDEAEHERRCAMARGNAERRMFKVRRDANLLVEPHPRLFARPEYWSTLEPDEQGAHIVRGVAMLHPDWVFSHYSAALVHGLYVSKNLLDNVHVASSYRGQNGSVAHHAARSRSYVVVDGIRVTPLIETIFECLRSCRFFDGLPIADSGLAKSGMSLDALEAAIASAWRTSPGIATALTTLSHADARSESGGESAARSIMIEEGLLVPDLQVEVPDPLEPGRVSRIDFLWKLHGGSRKVAGEFDGMRKYRNARFMGGRTLENVLVDERERESHLVAAGVSVIRFKYRHVLDRSGFVRLLESHGIPRIRKPGLFRLEHR